MARLPKGERSKRSCKIYRLLQRHRWGLRESEIAKEIGVHRRTVNNYLHTLEHEQKVEKGGWLWFSKR